MSSPSSRGPAFAAARVLSVTIGRATLSIDLRLLEDAIADAERALEVGMLDPVLGTFTHDAAGELRRELKLMRAVLAFRRDLEELRA